MLIFEVDITNIERNLLDYIGNINNESILEIIGMEVVDTDVRKSFEYERDPVTLEKWIPSQRVIKYGGKTLQKTGRLRKSITYEIDNEKVYVGTNVIYANRLFYGDEDNKLPARHFLGVGSDFLERVTPQIKRKLRL